MEKGKLVGKGMTAEVYEWGKDRVLKLFFKDFNEDWIKYEAKVGYAVHEAGVPSPAVFDTIRVGGRKGIIFQRVFGKSMLKHIQSEPWELYNYAQKLARLHYKIHQCSGNGLPSQRDRFLNSIRKSAKTLGYKEKKILDYIESMPKGRSVCHGDFHFNNIIVTKEELVPIDWTNAYQGNPLGDVARTCLMMSSPAKPPGMLDAAVLPFQCVKWSIYWTYLNEYMRLSKAKFESIDAWMLPAAAAKLRDKIPGEEDWLVDIINKRLKLYKA